MAQAVPNLCVSMKVFLLHQVNCNTVCGAIQDLPWRNIWSADNPVEVLNEHLSLLVGRYVTTKVIRVYNKEKPWFDDQCRRAFDLKQEAHLQWTRDRSRIHPHIFHQTLRSNCSFSALAWLVACFTSSLELFNHLPNSFTANMQLYRDARITLTF